MNQGGGNLTASRRGGSFGMLGGAWLFTTEWCWGAFNRTGT